MKVYIVYLVFDKFLNDKLTVFQCNYNVSINN